jgi:hypothetical protein
MSTREVLSHAFPWRISALEALIEASEPRTDNAERLRQVAHELDGVTALYPRASTAVTYAAFAELLRTLAMLVQWRAGVLGAERDADRYLTAAQALYRQWREQYASAPAAIPLLAAASGITNVSVVDDVGRACRTLASTPLPVIFSAEESVTISQESEDASGERPELEELTVVFLSFLIDGRPADAVHFLSPGAVHDLELEVNVSRWPESAELLRLTPMSIEQPSAYEFPIFEFPRPKGKPPFHLKDRGRAVLKLPQGLKARPFEFTYTAAFKPDRSEQPIGVVGQRTLTLEGIDLRDNPMTGYPGVDRKLLQIRDRLRALSRVSAADLEDVLTILTPLCSLAARALQDVLFKAVSSELLFQVEVRNELRRWPQIAGELDEHPHAAGGITDLSFRGIRIELKFEDAKPVDLNVCERFMAQTVSYVIANGKRVGILCVLDNSPKSSHSYPAEELIGLLIHQTQESDVCIVAVVIQGALPRPSDLSKK